MKIKLHNRPIILIFDTFAISILKNLFTPLNSFFFSPEDFSKIVSENSVIRSFERFFVIPTTLLKDLIYSHGNLNHKCFC